MGEEKEIFVPGRLCLFGEHSDWAGGHRRQNAEISKGYAIVAPTNQGNYAKVKRLDESVFRFISKPLGERLEVKLEEDELLKIAKEGGLFSYVAGVAHEIISSYQNHKEEGLLIENYRTDLPLKKGLSSSASVCVLTAKAFNEMFDLKMTTRRIMEVAYLGEITTFSRCGKLDQACAYSSPVLMKFDGDRVTTNELKVGKDMYLLIVDLNSKKNTVKILADLSRGFPFPTNELEQKKHFYFKNRNPLNVETAAGYLKIGDAEGLGELMSSAQKDFDEYLAPSCPEELQAPVLHSVLDMEDIQSFAYGGKCVGSGGDGTAQFVCKSKEDREKVKSILTEKGFGCMDLDLRKNL